MASASSRLIAVTTLAAVVAALGVATSSSAAIAISSRERTVVIDELSMSEAVCVETSDLQPFLPGSNVKHCGAPSTSVPVPAGWTLVWGDEFNGDSIDRSKWNVLNNSTYGDGNSELACLMDGPQNVRVSAGALTISAQAEASLKCGISDARFPGGRSFSSGHLQTKGKASFEYGRFEICAKTPIAHGSSKGMWPAFWLRPTDGGIGELDVFESMGSGAEERDSSNRTEQTIHYDYVRTYPKQNKNYTLPLGTFADGYHDYALEWEPGVIRWYVDGIMTYERTRATTPWIDEAFSRPFYLRLNLAVGGPVGTPTTATDFPANFIIDHVRVYQR